MFLTENRNFIYYKIINFNIMAWNPQINIINQRRTKF